jgi:hypothetical protein
MKRLIASIRGNGGLQTKEVTLVQGFAPVSINGGGGGGSVEAGVLTGDFMLRLPLDDFWPGVHLAPYFFAGFGGILIGESGNQHSVSETFTVTNSAGVRRDVTFTGRRVSAIRQNFGTDRVLGHFGGGLEYRFTAHIGLFGEAGCSGKDLRNRSVNGGGYLPVRERWLCGRDRCHSARRASSRTPLSQRQRLGGGRLF